jgi:polysaccharide export outer membrane protein
VPSGGADAQQPPAEQEKPQETAPEAVKPLSPTDASLPAPVDPKTYEIGVGDVLRIMVWREPDFSGAVVVRPDGKITLPIAGELEAAGLTPEKLGESVKMALSKYVNEPVLTVAVAEVRSRKYYVTGEVSRPAAYPLIVPTTVLEAIMNAGGFREYAKKNKITVLRKGKIVTKFNYNDVVEGKKSEQNILLENGDMIVVP